MADRLHKFKVKLQFEFSIPESETSKKILDGVPIAEVAADAARSIIGYAGPTTINKFHLHPDSQIEIENVTLTERTTK